MGADFLYILCKLKVFGSSHRASCVGTKQLSNSGITHHYCLNDKQALIATSRSISDTELSENEI